MATKKVALGKGLSALLPSVNERDAEEHSREGGQAAGASGPHALPQTRLYNFEERVRLLGRVAELELDAVRPNPYQPRQDFDEGALEELAASIRQLGIIQPITVRALGEGRFEIISGERRVRAARRAGLQRVPAYVREADTEAMLEMAIVENIQRENLNPVEIALGYHRLIEEVGLTQEEVARKVGKNRSTVTNTLRLLKLPPRVLASLRDGTLTGGHARMLVSIEDEEAQLELHRQIVENALSVRQVEELVREYRQRLERQDEQTPREAAAEAADAVTTPSRDDLHVDLFTRRLRDRLATQVAIRHRENGAGRIEIAYYSADDLERVLDLLLER
jgi:ParB family transcriptional regulator, chromosome partitioning protein